MNQSIICIDGQTIADGGNGNLQFSGCFFLYFPGAFPWKQNCGNHNHHAVFLCGNVSNKTFNPLSP